MNTQATTDLTVASVDLMTQEEATSKLEAVAKGIKTSVARAHLSIGRKLLAVRDSGLAMAAEFDTDLRHSSLEDHRTTALSKFYNLAGITRQRANEWLELAERTGQLEDAGIDASKFKEQTFRAIKSDVGADAFTGFVQGMLDDEETTSYTAKIVTGLAREAGLANAAKGGKSGKVDTLQAALNVLAQELGKVDELSKNQRTTMSAIIERLAVIGGATV